MIISAVHNRLTKGRRWAVSGFAATALAVALLVPVTPCSEASAQIVAAAKRSAARAATKQAAARQAARAATSRSAAPRQPDGRKGSAIECRGVRNKCDGIRRENAAQRLLAERFPNARVQAETFLRNRNGTKARDPRTGKARRIDFVLFDRGTAVKRYEVTSQRAYKKAQIARELRILSQRSNGQRRTGPVYVRDRKTGKLVPIDRRPSEVIRLK